MYSIDLRRHTLGVLLATLLLLVSCGGGDGGGSSPPPQPAPSNLSYAAPPSFVVGQAITSLTPTVTGSVSSYSVSPALPAGLTLNASSGVIAGTPTGVASQTTYTVTASNAGGSTTAGVVITVNDVAPAISYADTDYTFTTGVPIPPITPQNTGGTVVTWSISPALPAGLTLETTSGIIQGTPTVSAAAATYVVTAGNSGGQSSASLTIQVDSSLLLELGHTQSIKLLRFDGARAFSQDDGGYWVLWDVSSGEILASGQTPCEDRDCFFRSPADMAGGTVVIEKLGQPTLRELEVRDASTGEVVSTIQTNDTWQVAADGAYIITRSMTALTVYSRSGELLFSHAGNYNNGDVYAGAGEIRIGRGPAGLDVIETLTVPSGTRSVSPSFAGQFHSWFVDGERFLTTAATTVFTYSKTAVQEDIATLPTVSNLTGQGSWIWTYGAGSGDSLKIYAVGSSSSPPFTFPLATNLTLRSSGTTIGAFSGGSTTISVIDLAGATPVRSDRTGATRRVSAYAAVSSSEWLVGNQFGVILNESTPSSGPRRLGYGAVWGMAGSQQRVAIATASGHILYFNAATKALEGTIEFPSSQLTLSSSGNVLAAAAAQSLDHVDADPSVKIFSLPAGTQLHSWPYSDPYPYAEQITLSGSGTMFGQVVRTSSGGNYERQVTAPTGGPVIWSDVVSSSGSTPVIRLSPDGSLIAAAIPGAGSTFGTNILQNGTLTTAIAGWPAGWIDNDRILINTQSGGQFQGSEIYNSAGIKLSSPSLPELQSFQTVASDRVYWPQRNIILSLTTGETLWSSPNGSLGGVVAGGYIVFPSGGRVLAEPY